MNGIWFRSIFQEERRIVNRYCYWKHILHTSQKEWNKDETITYIVWLQGRVRFFYRPSHVNRLRTICSVISTLGRYIATPKVIKKNRMHRSGIFHKTINIWRWYETCIEILFDNFKRFGLIGFFFVDSAPKQPPGFHSPPSTLWPRHNSFFRIGTL